MTQKQTKISALVSVLIAINGALCVFGVTAFENVGAEQLYTVVSMLFVAGKWAYDHWFNHNYTSEAYDGQLVIEEEKAAKAYEKSEEGDE